MYLSRYQINNRKQGKCEVCDAGNVFITIHYNGMWFCDDCWKKEQEAKKEAMEPETEITAVDKVNTAVRESRQMDDSIQVRTDLFNAATTSIIDLRKSIDEDTSITNKPFALAEELLRRFTHFKSVVFELNQQIVEAGNQQKAIQVYLNHISNSLRAEEREKLRIADITYRPTAIKPDKPKSIKTSKIDKVELRKYASELGISEFTLQMVVVQKGITVEAAANLLRRSIRESQSEASN